MGNLCSKSANQDDNFSTPGRALGSSSQPQPTTAPVPQKITSGTSGRTVGGSERPGSSSDPKSAAAAAAEARAAGANKPGGKLANDLAKQKKQTQNQTLAAGSEHERRTRDADQTAQAQQYN